MIGSLKFCFLFSLKASCITAVSEFFAKRPKCKVVAVVVQLPYRVQFFATPQTAAQQTSLSLTISRSLPKFVSIGSVMPSSHLILRCPLLLLLSIFPSIKDFSDESAVCIRQPEYWSFNSSISPSNEYSGLISLKIDWFALLPVQGALRSLLQQLEGINSSVLLYSPALRIHDYWEDRSLDYMGLCWQSNVCFSAHYRGLS